MLMPRLLENAGAALSSDLRRLPFEYDVDTLTARKNSAGAHTNHDNRNRIADTDGAEYSICRSSDCELANENKKQARSRGVRIKTLGNCQDQYGAGTTCALGSACHLAPLTIKQASTFTAMLQIRFRCSYRWQ